MSAHRLEIQESPPVTPFLVLSIALHIGVGLLVTLMIALGMMPEQEVTETKHPPVKVKYVPPEKKTPPQKLADITKPREIETPKSSELIASYDSRAHSNQSPQKDLRYQNKKTVVPKTKKTTAAPKKLRPEPIKKTVPQPNPTPIKKPFRLSEKGFIRPKAGKAAPDPSPKKRISGGTLALLDGFDADKYARMDTHSKTVEDDEEAISLNTRESKYASYFARIKRQIELVWSYPEEAQRKRITGQLTLRFQISRDGNLMNVKLIDGSGHEILDHAALQAVKSAAPYYPFPVTIDRETLPILANFVYSPRQDARYLPNP